MYAHRIGVSETETAALRKAGGRWLRERREAARLTQRQLAEAIGIEYVTLISQIEAGRGRVPPDRYRAWAQAIGMSPRDFVREILRFYDPVTYHLLFEDESSSAAMSDRTTRSV